MIVVAHRTRQVMAALMVGLLPGATYFWGMLYVSGYARNADGSRNFGLMEKLVGPATVTVFELLFGIPTLVAGCVCLAIARATGAVTLLRLTAIAVAVGAIIPLAIAIISALTNPISVWQFALPAAAALGSASLATFYGVVVGLPLRRSPTPLDPNRRPIADAVALGVGTVVAVGLLAWLASLYAWGLAHPCHSCG